MALNKNFKFNSSFGVFLIDCSLVKKLPSNFFQDLEKSRKGVPSLGNGAGDFARPPPCGSLPAQFGSDYEQTRGDRRRARRLSGRVFGGGPRP